MTTTVTIQTADWPIAMSISDHHNRPGKTSRSHGWTSTEEFIPPQTRREIALTDTRSISLRELPKEAADLDYGMEAGQDTAVGTGL